MEQRNSIILGTDIQMNLNSVTPVGVYVPYAQDVRHTFCKIMSTVPPPKAQDFPLQFQIADGVDGYGSHTIYNQSNTNTDTKTFIIFCFKTVQITCYSGREMWKKTCSNSPFTQCPLFLLADKESEVNISNS